MYLGRWLLGVGAVGALVRVRHPNEFPLASPEDEAPHGPPMLEAFRAAVADVIGVVAMIERAQKRHSAHADRLLRQGRRASYVPEVIRSVDDHNRPAFR